MKVRAIPGKVPNEDESARLLATRFSLPDWRPANHWCYTEKRVYGMGLWRGLSFIWIVNSDEAAASPTLVFAPLLFFDITDPRVSALWRVRHHADGDVNFWPTAMHGDYYTEELADGNEQAVAAFDRVRRFMQMEEEFYLQDDPPITMQVRGVP